MTHWRNIDSHLLSLGLVDYLAWHGGTCDILWWPAPPGTDICRQMISLLQHKQKPIPTTHLRWKTWYGIKSHGHPQDFREMRICVVRQFVPVQHLSIVWVMHNAGSPLVIAGTALCYSTFYMMAWHVAGTFSAERTWQNATTRKNHQKQSTYHSEPTECTCSNLFCKSNCAQTASIRNLEIFHPSICTWTRHGHMILGSRGWGGHSPMLTLAAIAIQNLSIFGATSSNTHIFKDLRLKIMVFLRVVINYLVARVQTCMGIWLHYSAYEMHVCGATNENSKSQ